MYSNQIYSYKYLPDFTRKKKPKHCYLGFNIKSLAIPYFRMANCHTIIGAKRFHFRVRDGIWWFTLAMVTKQTGVSVLQPTSLQQVFYEPWLFLASVSLYSLLWNSVTTCVLFCFRLRLADAKFYLSL